MRTKRGGYKQRTKAGRPKVRAKAKVDGGGTITATIVLDRGLLPDHIRLAAISGRVANWRTLGPGVTIEPLAAGLMRYLRFRG